MKIVIFGKPIAKQRARYSKRGKHVVTYDPQEEEKREVKAKMIAAINTYFCRGDKAKLIEAGQIATCETFIVDFRFYLPVAESTPELKKNRMLWGMELPNKKPDYDNLEKFYLDCANGVLWKDDSMIIEASAEKFYSENPRVEIRVMPKQKRKLASKEEEVLTLFSPKSLHEFCRDAEDISMLAQSENTLLECNDETFIGITEIIGNFAQKYAKLLSKAAKISAKPLIQYDFFEGNANNVGRTR